MKIMIYAGRGTYSDWWNGYLPDELDELMELQITNAGSGVGIRLILSL